MDAPTRRTVIVVAVLALATLSFLGGGYTFGLLTDQEETGASFQAASDFEDRSTRGDVSFRGCGQVRFRPANVSTFAATLTLYNSASQDRETVTLNEDDAGAEDGFRFDSGREQYRFDVHEHYNSTDEEDKILALRLDGKRFENERQCADTDAGTESGAIASTGETTVTTATAGNAESTTPVESGEEGSDETGDATTGTAARATTNTTAERDS